MQIVRNARTFNHRNITVLVGRNVQPKRTTVAKFLGIDATKAQFEAAKSQSGRIYVRVTYQVIGG